ncbi:MAG: circadian clock protein KaiC [Rhodoferax sp.]|nr:circadian clock protein KaiC [Rhodoferax sp.]
MPQLIPIPKSSTGIQGLDELTGGGLPQGRTTLVCGGAGCGKTLLAMEFLVHGATRFGEPGMFMAFEETAADLTQNVASLGFDLDDLVARNMLAIDFVRVDRSELEQSGDYDLEGLFIRLGHAIDRIGAKRVVLDTIESLFSDLPNQGILRAELRRLFRWLKAKGVTAVITGERGSDPLALTRQGLEEYVSDCVIVLDHRVTGMVSSRRLRVVKYRGSTHGTNEYPFLIDEDGISVLPVTSLGLQHLVSNERVPSGVAGLNAMLGGEGYFRGSSVLVSGTAGTGKSSLAAHLTKAACARGERVLYFAFEESSSQIIRNMNSIGIDLKPWVDQGLLQIHAARPTLSGLEMHLATMLKQIARFDPQVVVVDPLNSFVAVDNEDDVKMMLLRLVDALKRRQITAFFTSLTSGGAALDQTDIAISSLIDTWLLVRDMESGGERNRGLYILKSRGMPHSNQIREFLLTGHGIELRQAYIGPAGVLTGSARLAQEARELSAKVVRDLDIQRRQDEIRHKRIGMDAQIVAIRADFAAEETAALALIEQAQASEELLALDRQDMAHSRKVEAA